MSPLSELHNEPSSLCTASSSYSIVRTPPSAFESSRHATAAHKPTTSSPLASSSARQQPDVFEDAFRRQMISPLDFNDLASAAENATAAATVTIVAREDPAPFAFPTHSPLVTPSFLPPGHAVDLERVNQLAQSRRTFSFGKTLMSKLSHSKPARRFRKGTGSPSTFTSVSASPIAPRSGFASPASAYSGYEAYRPVLMGPSTSFHHTRVRSDSAPEVWSGHGAASDAARQRTEGRRIGHRLRPSLPGSRLGSMMNVHLLRRSKRTDTPDAGTRTPQPVTSALSASRPASDAPSPALSPAEVQADTVPVSTTIVTHAEDTRVYPSASATRREPVLLRQRAPPATVAAQTAASAAGAVFDPRRASSALTHRRNLFDQMLPRELKLLVLRAVIAAVIDERERSPKYRSARHEPHHAALQQLARLARVSRTWASLVLDGQLWSSLAMDEFEGADYAAILRLSAATGCGLRHLRLRGMGNLSSATFLELIANTVHAPLAGAEAFNGSSLTALDISHCAMLSEDALVPALRCLPALRSLTARSVPSLSDTAVCALAEAASGMEELDLSDNAQIGERGLRSVADSLPHLRVLKISGARGISADFMAQLGQHAAGLEVLDVSYCKCLTDDMLAALVSTEVRPDVAPSTPAFFSLLPPHRVAADPFASVEGVYRRVSKLRAISVTGCRGLSDRACAWLAGSVPRLEVFEAAGIGPAMRDAGIVALIESAPHLQKLDLDGALELTDAVIDSLLSHDTRGKCEITHLVLSHANRITPEAWSELVASCPALCHLEVDDTRAGDAVAREFIESARRRRKCNAYLGMVDCRGLTKPTAMDLLASGESRPRAGKVGHAYRHFDYDVCGDTSGKKSEPPTLKELDDSRVVVKSFWGWQAVDARSEAMRKTKGRRRRPARPTDDDRARASSSDDDEGQGTRLSRLTTLLLTGGDEADNAASCSVM